jgi:hypothetical protein
MVASTGLVLAAGRFGLAPSANRLASAGAFPIVGRVELPQQLLERANPGF